MNDDPIEHIRNDRADARRLNDPNADLCVMALASEGKASVRTLVLRDIIDHRFVVFMNQTSPKWHALVSGASYELLLWYTSQQRQYRISGSFETMDPETVRNNWQRRPMGSKLLDYVYKEFAGQSTRIDSREALVNEIGRLRRQYAEDGMEAPPQAAGVQLIATQIEMLDLNREDRIHDRRRYTWDRDQWQCEFIIP